jgi:hypothetical protein
MPEMTAPRRRFADFGKVAVSGKAVAAHVQLGGIRSACRTVQHRK